MESWVYPELERRIQARTGAAHVIVLGHLSRFVDPPKNPGGFHDSAKEVRPATKVDGSVNSAHNDVALRPWNKQKERLVGFLDPKSHRHALGGLVGSGDPRKSGYLRNALQERGLTPEFLCAKTTRLQIVSAWRGIEPFPVIRTPFAVCDARTINAERDTVDTVFPSYTTGAGGVVFDLIESHNMNSFCQPEQQWYYYPAMQREEVLLMKIFDSIAYDTGAPLKVQFHSAFEDPNTPASAPYRRSCELRCLCVFPDAYKEEKEKQRSKL